MEELANEPAFPPVIEAALRVTAAGVVFEMVMVCDTLTEPVTTLPKDRPAGDTVTFPDALPVASPVSETFCGLLVAASVMVSVAVRVPGAVGRNRTVIVQLPDATSEAPQVF